MKSLNICLSALKLSEYREFKPKEWDRNRYQDLFALYTGSRNRYRIYLPLNNQNINPRPFPLKKVPSQIRKAVDQLGFQIEDYRLGLAKPKASTKKNVVSLGKILPNDLLKQFVNDPNRQGVKTLSSDYMVVVSRHPYDLIGMSTGRGWTSCVDIRRNKSNVHYLKSEPDEGSLIAYLVKKIKGKNNQEQFDLNLTQPVARIKIYSYQVDTSGPNLDLNQGQLSKPYYLVPSKIYGNVAGVPEFLAVVKRFCDLANRRQKLTRILQLDPHRVYLDESNEGLPIPSSVLVISDFNQVFDPALALITDQKNAELKISDGQRRQLLDHLIEFPDKINDACLLVISRTKDSQYPRLDEVINLLDEVLLIRLASFGSSSPLVLREMLKRRLPLLTILDNVRVKIKDPGLIRELFNRVVTEQEGDKFLVSVRRPLDTQFVLEGLRSDKEGHSLIAVYEIQGYPNKNGKLGELLDYASHKAKARILNSIRPKFTDLSLFLEHFDPSNKQDVALVPSICRAYSKEKALLAYLVRWINHRQASIPTLTRYLFYVADNHYVSQAAYDYVLTSLERPRLKTRLWLCLSFIIYRGSNDFIRKELDKLLKSESAELELARALVHYCASSRAFNAGLVTLLDELMSKKQGKAYEYLMKNLDKLSLD